MKTGFPEALFDYCSIEGCGQLGTNCISIMLDNLFDSHYLRMVCDKHYYELMTKYYDDGQKSTGKERYYEKCRASQT
jgi:hypothetical protein